MVWNNTALMTFGPPNRCSLHRINLNYNQFLKWIWFDGEPHALRILPLFSCSRFVHFLYKITLIMKMSILQCIFLYDDQNIPLITHQCRSWFAFQRLCHRIKWMPRLCAMNESASVFGMPNICKMCPKKFIWWAGLSSHGANEQQKESIQNWEWEHRVNVKQMFAAEIAPP